MFDRNTQPAPKLPERFVDQAETLIKDMQSDRISISSSKLYNMFCLFSETYNKCMHANEEKLSNEQMASIQAARVRIVYECGRDPIVKTFVNKTGMLNYLRDIGDSKGRLINYYHYLEALVAYGKYYGVISSKK